MNLFKSYLQYLEGCSIESLAIDEAKKEKLKKYTEITTDLLLYDISKMTGFKISTLREFKRISRAHDEGKKIETSYLGIKEVRREKH